MEHDRRFARTRKELGVLLDKLHDPARTDLTKIGIALEMANEMLAQVWILNGGTLPEDGFNDQC